ncbi:unnamed protein product [Caenorhabditis sp. 36 PRJEB53466]|nr:unnamed protein product [Caenorhabditis sp. 36 PRJEB53466]
MGDSKETDKNLSGQSNLPVADLEPMKEKKLEEGSKEEVKKEEEKKDFGRKEDEKKLEGMKKGEESKSEESKKKEKSSSSKKKTKTAKSKSKSTKSARQRLSIRRTLREDPAKDMKATLLTFQAVRNKLDQARVQLLLCNISDRDIFVKLRCNSNSNVTALPASSGHIAPKSQMRILLNWKMPDGVGQWSELPMPKILLTTYFMGEKTNDEAPTNTRLMARVSTSKQCDPDNSPIEQLLLDAVGKDTAVTGATPSTPNTAVPPTLTPIEPTPEKKVPKKEEKDEDDEVDNLRWIIIALVMVIVLLLLQK